jgi:hypothetical protein
MKRISQGPSVVLHDRRERLYRLADGLTDAQWTVLRAALYVRYHSTYDGSVPERACVEMLRILDGFGEGGG